MDEENPYTFTERCSMIERHLSMRGYSKESYENLTDQNSDFGTVLSWDPNTGSLQLTQAATQRLLESLGGRLARSRDRGITIFFPTAEVV